MPIPRIIHQVWFQFPNGAAEPPATYDEMRASWVEKHPEWEVKLWTSSMARAFLKEHYPEALPIFDGYKKEILRVDAIRYFLLHFWGGFYVDCDTSCLVGLEALTSEKVVLVDDVTPWLFRNNGFMGAEPQHPLLASCIKNLYRTRNLTDPIVATGPLYLSANWFASKQKKEIRVLSVKEAKTYFEHYHHASWTGGSFRWLKALIQPERRAFVKASEVPKCFRSLFPA